MATSISAPQQTPLYKIKRKPAPTLLSPISPVTPLRAPNVDGVESPPVDVTKTISPSDPPSPSPKSNVTHSRATSTSLFTNPRYPPPDINDPFAPLSVLRDRNRRCSINPSSSDFAAGSDVIVSLRDIDTRMASTDNLSISASTKSSFIPLKAAKTLGVFPKWNDDVAEKKRPGYPRKKSSIYSFELYPDPPSGIRVYGDMESEEENLANMGTPKKTSTRSSSKTPKSKVSTPTKPGSGPPIGHYTPHSRQRAQSSFSILSSPSPQGKLHVLIPAPEVYPPRSLVRDRSESSACSSGTGGHSHSGSTSDSANSALLTPGSSIPPSLTSGSGSGSSSDSPIDMSESYALTMALLSSAQTHPYAQSEAHGHSRSHSASRDSSPSRSAYVGHAKTNSPGHTPRAERTREKGSRDLERTTPPISGMSKLARFFTGGKGLSRKSSVGSLMVLDGSPSKIEKTKGLSPSSKVNRGRARTRKLSTASINISGPVSAPVSIPMGQDLRQVDGLPRPTNRPRSHTTSGIPPTMSTLPASNRPSPYSSGTSKPPSASVSSIGLGTAIHANEFGIISDQEVENEIGKDVDISRLKPWAASIPRKRSSLSLSTLPTPAIQEKREWDMEQQQSIEDTRETTGSGSSLSLPKGTEAEEDGSLATCGTRKSKGSGESAVSAGSMGSSYIHVMGSTSDGTDAKSEAGQTREGDYVWPRSAPIPSRSKQTPGPPKSNGTHGIAGIRFPGFRRSPTGSQALRDITSSSSLSGSVRGLKISGPMLQTPVPQTPGFSPISPTPPAPPSIQGHGRAMSDSDISVLDRSVRSASPLDMDIPEDDEDEAVSSTRLPTSFELETLLALPLLDENGQKLAFGDVLDASGSGESGKNIIVLFIRHFWCPLDQDYVQEVRDLLGKLSDIGAGWQLATEEGEVQIGDGEGKKDIPEVIIVSNGSPALIAKYKEIFGLGGERASELRVKMFSDPTCRIYTVLGMGNMGEACVNVSPRPSTPTTPSMRESSSSPNPPDSPMSSRSRSGSHYDAGIPLVRIDHRTPPRKDTKGHRKSRSLAPSSALFPPSGMLRSRSRSPSPSLLSPDTLDAPLEHPLSQTPSTSSTQGHSRSSYVKHASVIGGLASVVLRAVKVGMPVWEKGGAIRQLGGEVIFRVMQDRGPDDPTRGCNLKVSCTYAHRMQNTQDHIPFGEVLKIALTASPSNEFVSFRTSAAAIGLPSSSSAGYSSMSNLHPAYERSLSAPIQSLGGVQQGASSAPCSPVRPSHGRAQTDVFIERSNAAVWRAPTDEESQDEVPEYSERIMSDSELETSMDGVLDSWGNQLHILRTRASENVTGSTSESIRAIRGRDSVRSSTGSAAASSIRAMRAVRVPRGPRMRMQSASAESLTCSRSRETIRSIGSGMDGIESVLEFGESISSPDLSLLAQLGKEATSSWRGRYATDSTSTLNLSVYYDAPEGVLEAVDAGEDTEEEEEGELGVTVDVVPVQSRPASRVTQSPEMQDQTFDSIQSEYSTASADRTEHLTSICSETSDGFEDDAEKLREILVMRASSSIRGRGI